MFKPLLKVIPSLSGNMKINCFCEEYSRENNSNEYNCIVQNARLVGITNILYDNNIDLNLKNNSFEYDVKKFYDYYSDVFHSTCFNYSKQNIPILKEDTILDDSNQAFFYGCKRISYLKYKNQLSFFAPIYIDNVNDLNGVYFKIKCEFKKDKLKLDKYLKIYIDNHNPENYLGEYINRYVSKIDDKVIYLSSSYKNIYYGINLLNGGFLKIEDNISASIYSKYYPINDFDSLINGGFKRNRIMMKQILALNFCFDPKELLSEYENNLYKCCEINISGCWYKNDEQLDFYTFSDNYNSLYDNVYNIDIFGKVNYLYTNKNIMNIDYPAFNESKLINYKFVNTINKNYNRWKLIYSDDEHPYYINANFAFSDNQNSLYMYKEFPLIYSSIPAICESDTKNSIQSKYTLKFDYKDRYNESNKLINNKEKYNNFYNNNYITSFYCLWPISGNILEDSSYWGDVAQDNKIYYKGILYDLNKLYKEYKDLPRIDKFALFVNPNFNYISSDEYSTYYKTIKNYYEINIDNENSYSYIKKDNNESIVDIDFYNLIENNSSYISNNITKKIKSDIDLTPYKIKQYDKYNQYYDLNDIYIYNHLHNQENSIFDKYPYEIIESYRLLEIHNKENIYNKIFKEIISLYNINENYNDSNIFFREKRVLELENLYWTKDILYFSIYPNPVIYNLFDNFNLLNSTSVSKINIFLKTKFVKSTEFNQFIQDNNLTTFIHNNEIKNIVKYHYINGLFDIDTNIIYTIPCFRIIDDLYCNYAEDYTDEDDNVIYIDPYNLKYLYSKYLFNDSIDIRSLYVNNSNKTFYYKFLNINHIILYCKKLYNYEGFNSSINMFNTIYIKFLEFDNYIIDTSISNYQNKINIKNEYIQLSKFGIDNLNKILKYIDYNKNGYFFFNNLYFTDMIDNDEISETIKNTIKKYHLYNFDICFSKPAIKLNKELYSLIMSLDINQYHKYKDLYLYHIEDPKDIKYEINYQTSELLSYNSSWELEQNEIVKNNLLSLINMSGKENICLEPYFNDIYEENQTDTKIYSDYFLNNILEVKYNDFSYYKFKTCNIDTLFIYNSNNINNEELYNLNLENNLFDDLYEKDHFTDNNELSYHININTIDNINYGYYVISTYFDNTCHTLNIKNDMYKTINSVDYIENYAVEDIKSNISYLYSIYPNVLPYIKNSNIISYTLDNINSIIIPNNYKFLNHYRQHQNINDLTLYYYDKTNTIELIRYFDHITPYIYKTNKVYTYNLYYKNTEEFIEHELFINKKINSYIYSDYPNISFIYEFDGISYFNYNNFYNGKNIIDKYIPVEYKYFNDNVFYNLPTNFVLNVNNVFNTELEVAEFEKTDIAFRLFKEYICSLNSLFKLESDNRILFLYNKYKVVFSTIKEVDNIGEYKYKLIIKYTLL